MIPFDHRRFIDFGTTAGGWAYRWYGTLLMFTTLSYDMAYDHTVFLLISFRLKIK